ncbi:MAG: hypothetical protein LBH55_00580 [Mycoplasmataceae bacterium]|nr:hypothetical protein [Mycoplasmataceae bacterium]
MLSLKESDIKTKFHGFFKPIFFTFLIKQSLWVLLATSFINIFFTVGFPSLICTNTENNNPKFFAVLVAQMFTNMAAPCMMIAVLLLAKKIVTLVNNGDLVYIFCSKTTRTQIVFTQFIMLFATFLMVNVISILVVYCVNVVNDYQLFSTELGILFINKFLIEILLASVALFFSCLFNKTGKYFAVLSVLFMFFYVANIVATIGETLSKQMPDLEWMTIFKYLTVFTLFSGFIGGMGGMGTVSSQIIFEIDWDGETMSIICMSVVSIIFLIATWFVFKRKDLPI